jgi:hypothetical protein
VERTGGSDSFIAWGAVFWIHVLAHLREMLQSLRSDWTVPGARMRLALVLGGHRG